MPAQLVLKSIGYKAIPLAGVAFDASRGIIPNRHAHAPHWSTSRCLPPKTSVPVVLEETAACWMIVGALTPGCMSVGGYDGDLPV